MRGAAPQTILIGLTGGVGMGKSTAAGILSGLGVPVLDTDAVARQIVEPGEPALSEVTRVFGEEMVGPDGRLRRDALAKRVFAEPSARTELEAILHPRIREVWLRQATAWRQESRPLGVVIIPLLFETRAAEHFQATVCCACSRATQVDRLRGRGWTDLHIQQRIAAQWPVEKKIEAATFAVWTEGSLRIHEAQLRLVMRKWANADRLS